MRDFSRGGRSSGKLVQTVANMKKRLESLKITLDTYPEHCVKEREFLNGRIDELELCIHMIEIEYLGVGFDVRH